MLEHNDDLSPRIVIKNPQTLEDIREYPLAAGTLLMVKKGQRVSPGTTLARIPYQQQRNKDITGGLPRVAELFEARTPKDIAEISQIDGYFFTSPPEGKKDIAAYKTKKGRVVYVTNPDTEETSEHHIPNNKHLIVSNGEYVKKGQKLTTGAVIPQDLLRICGAQELQRYLVNEVQNVYRSQGVEINDKHIEIIIRQMMQKVRIVDKCEDGSSGQGDTRFLAGELVDRYEFDRENKRVAAAGGRPAEAEPVLLGITKASLETNRQLHLRRVLPGYHAHPDRRRHART